MRRVSPPLLALLTFLVPPGAYGGEPTPEPAPEECDGAETPPAWCAPELEGLEDGLCYFLPEGAAPPKALVIFLHGVIKPGTAWQWAQQRAMVRNARRLGLAVLLPRGRRGTGPKGMQDWWTWPTSVAAQRAVEADLIAEWQRGREALEAKVGARFDRLYVFGFSNGAYYASSLALRARLEADGYALFAGGTGAPYLARTARAVERRAPIYVGYGEEDRAAARDCRRLKSTLGALRWPHRAVGRPGVGHSMTDAQVAEAVRFLEASR